MKKIVLLGAGRSAIALIKYLLKEATAQDWHLRVGEYAVHLAEEKIAGADKEHASAFEFDIHNPNSFSDEIAEASIVISMLPAAFHPIVAKECLKHKKSMLSASYVSPEIRAMEQEVKEAGLLFLKECGLDPGLDHMSAMQVIDGIRAKGGEITSFKSYTGGLVAPEFDNNPWHYKFTWNPRNVVLAGQGMAKYQERGAYKYVPYHKLFKRLETVEFEEMGAFEGYPNRDSLVYKEIYGLSNIKTLLRGTLRQAGYCEAWDVFVQLGMTDDTQPLQGVENMTYRDFLNAFMPYDTDHEVEDKLCYYLGLEKNGEVFEKLKWLGLFEDKTLPVNKGTSAQVLQAILEEKWALEPGDKDMIVMQHQFEYELNGEKKGVMSSLISYGDNEHETAMAKTVGLPLGIACKLILQGKIKMTGIQIPIKAEIYTPILQELEQEGIRMVEKKFRPN